MRSRLPNVLDQHLTVDLHLNFHGKSIHRSAFLVDPLVAGDSGRWRTPPWIGRLPSKKGGLCEFMQASAASRM
jgi:hypothetical protein